MQDGSVFLNCWGLISVNLQTLGHLRSASRRHHTCLQRKTWILTNMCDWQPIMRFIYGDMFWIFSDFSSQTCKNTVWLRGVEWKTKQAGPFVCGDAFKETLSDLKLLSLHINLRAERFRHRQQEQNVSGLCKILKKMQTVERKCQSTSFVYMISFK